jgi:hypothetical protein
MMIHFYRDEGIVERVIEKLSVDGRLFIMTFMKGNQEMSEAKESIAMSSEDIKRVIKIGEVIKQKEYKDERGNQIGIVIKKRA